MGKKVGLVVGNTALGQDISKNPYTLYICVVCPECGGLRWTELRYYRNKPYRLCIKCSVKANARKLTATRKAQAKHLTSKQYRVLSLMGQGLPNKQIALRLRLSKHTIDNHCNRIFKKLDVDNRVSAVMKGLYGRKAQ